MKSIKTIFLDIANFIIGLVGFCVIAFAIIFIILWNSGFIEQYYPRLHCNMTKVQKDRFFEERSGLVGKVTMDNDCNCDTTYYQPILADTSHESIQTP